MTQTPSANPIPRFDLGQQVEALLSYEGEPRGFLQQLLAAQAMAAGAAQAAVLVQAPEGAFAPAAVLGLGPADLTEPPAWLQQAAEAAARSTGQEGASQASQSEPLPGGVGRWVMVPVPTGPGPDAVTVVAVPHALPAEAWQPLVRRVRLLGATASSAFAKHELTTEQARGQTLQDAVRVLGRVYRRAKFLHGAVALCNALSDGFGFRRVSLGVIRAGHTKVRAMSGTEHVIRKMTQSRAVELAMDEAADQGETVLHPAPDGMAVVSTAARRLSERHGPHRIVTMPIRDERGTIWGVLLTEGDPDRLLNPQELEALGLILELVSPPLARLELASRWFGARWLASGKRAAAWAVGPRQTGIKLAALLALALLLWLLTAKGTDRVDGSFVMETAQRAVIEAPFDGEIDLVLVEPGDTVQAGQTVLATLRTDQKQLELASIRADASRSRTEAAVALREGQTAEVQIAEAQALQAEARAAVLQYEIDQAQITSPVSGVVVEGDFKRRLGVPVSRGEVMYEVADPTRLTVAIDVPEQRIAEVQPGMTGRLAPASAPGQKSRFTVTRIEPLPRVVEQRNVYRVWAELDLADATLYPGMEGVAKVEVGRRHRVLIWTRDAVDWVRLKLWW